MFPVATYIPIPQGYYPDTVTMTDDRQDLGARKRYASRSSAAAKSSANGAFNT